MNEPSEVEELAKIMGLKDNVADRVRRSYLFRAKKILNAGYARSPQSVPALRPINRKELSDLINEIISSHWGYFKDETCLFGTIEDEIMLRFGQIQSVPTEILKDWLKFSEDVMPHDAAGHDWLEGLRERTKHLLGESK